MNEKDHPRGLSPEDRKKWCHLCKELFVLYRKMPMGETSRKCIAMEDDFGNCMMVFIGNEEECITIRNQLG